MKFVKTVTESKEQGLVAEDLDIWTKNMTDPDINCQ